MLFTMQDAKRAGLNNFESRRANSEQLLLVAYAEPTADSAAVALHDALALHGLTSLLASATELTGRAYDADPWVDDGRVYLVGWAFVGGRQLGDSPVCDLGMSIEEAVSLAWLLLERPEGQVCYAEVEEDFERVKAGARAPLIAGRIERAA